MKKRIQKIFGIYPEEGKNVIRFIILTVLWSSSSSIIYIISTTLFLENVGAGYLPISYMITALLLIFISIILIYFLRISSPYKVFYTIIFLSILFFGSFTFIINTHSGIYFYFILQIFSYSFMASLIASYWNFLDQYHDLQDAKRMYGMYNTAYFLGYMISGCLINFTYEKLGKTFLFSIATILMFLALLEIKKIYKKIKDI